MRRALLALVLLTPLTAHAQRAVSGFVEDAATRERLPGASVYEPRSRIGAAANGYGFFALAFADDAPRTLRVSYVGYRDTLLAVTPADVLPLVIRLRPDAARADTLDVVAAAAPAYGPRPLTLTVAEVRRVPALLGEADVLRAFQLMPGVQGGHEGTAGLHVRGGSPEQNLILLDGAPVYNVSHLLGFFSVFNDGAVSSATLVKDGFPARYGGRLSSVFDVTMREGNRARHAFRGQVGLLASAGTLEGPLPGVRGGYLVSARRTYADILLRPFMTEDSRIGYRFYDLNAKLNADLSPTTRAFVSLYAGDDGFERRSRETFAEPAPGKTEASSTALGWGNRTATVRLTRALGHWAFGSATFMHSRYRFRTALGASEDDRTPPATNTSYRIAYGSGLRDVGGRLDVEAALGARHTASAGAGVTHHAFEPDRFEQRSTDDGQTTLDTALVSRVGSVEAFAYAEDLVRVGAARLRLGLHASALRVQGTSFGSVQPRLSASLPVGGGWTASASFTTMRQYVHLLTNNGVDLPTDFWVPATRRTGPEDATQATLGVERTFGAGTHALRIDAYAKRLRGVLAYRDGASFIESGTGWEDKLVRGTGRAAGLEVLAERRRGRTTGWVSYTLASATRRFDEVDGGRAFPYRYDRRHNLALVATRALSARRSASATFTFATGTAVTLPVGRYTAGDQDYRYYEGRNGYRLRPSHRLDVAYRVAYPARRGRPELSLGLYNAYSRMNPFYVRVAERPSGVVYEEVGLFPVLPFVTYAFSL